MVLHTRLPTHEFEADNKATFICSAGILLNSKMVNPPSWVGGVVHGRLCDVAPTLLQLLGLDQPAAMTGRSLLVAAERTPLRASA